MKLGAIYNRCGDSRRQQMAKTCFRSCISTARARVVEICDFQSLCHRETRNTNPQATLLRDMIAGAVFFLVVA